MTDPISPDDTAALSERLNPIAAALVEYIIEADARAARPPGYVMVSRDDLRAVLDMYKTGARNTTSDYEVLDRLRAKLD